MLHHGPRPGTGGIASTSASHRGCGGQNSQNPEVLLEGQPFWKVGSKGCKTHAMLSLCKCGRRLRRFFGVPKGTGILFGALVLWSLWRDASDGLRAQGCKHFSPGRAPLHGGKSHGGNAGNAAGAACFLCRFISLRYVASVPDQCCAAILLRGRCNEGCGGDHSAPHPQCRQFPSSDLQQHPPRRICLRWCIPDGQSCGAAYRLVW